MIRLVNLKNIFSKQLPNMPKEYIVRLVMDPRHHSMICLKNNTVIGGIVQAVLEAEHGEIAFCAERQPAGDAHGTRLINYLKEYVCDKENMTHSPVRDNNAVDIFRSRASPGRHGGEKMATSRSTTAAPSGVRPCAGFVQSSR